MRLALVDYYRAWQFSADVMRCYGWDFADAMTGQARRRVVDAIAALPPADRPTIDRKD